MMDEQDQMTRPLSAAGRAQRDLDLGLDRLDAARGMSRRMVTRAAAWSVPVIAVSAAAPAFAASCLADLSTRAFFPNETPDSNADGLPTYAGLRFMTFDVTYRNEGPNVQPAGSTVSFSVFYSGYWDSITISSNPSSIPLTFVGRTEEPGTTNLGEPGARAVWTWTVGAALAVGQTFTLTYRVRLRAVPAFGPTYPTRPRLGSRPQSRISGSCQDPNLANNTDFGDNQFYIDNSANFTGATARTVSAPEPIWALEGPDA